jgi:hypothetical protein
MLGEFVSSAGGWERSSGPGSAFESSWT